MGATKTEISCAICGVVFVILIGFFGALHSDDLNKAPKKGSEHLIKNRCVTAECMDAAAWLMGNMDDHYDPCDDFYNRACANYANQHPFENEDTETSVLKVMKTKNRERLNEIISLTPDLNQWGHMYSVAKMVNDFYRACINQYERSTSYTSSNNPVIPVIEQQLGTAWWVADPSRIDDFDWQSAMRETARDQNFVFFRIQPVPRAKDVSKNLIEIIYDDSPIFNWETRIGRHRQPTRTFRAFVKAVGKLLAKDSGFNVSSPDIAQRITQFADDVENVTKTFAADITLAQLFGSNGGHFHKVFNYSSFIQQTGNDFVQWDHFIDTYTDGKMILRSSTPIVEHFRWSPNYSYSSKISQRLKAFQRDPEFRRKMNNYFTFRIIFYWMPDLNYDYNHLYQMYLALFHDINEMPTDAEICMKYVDFAMPQTLGALYVTKFYRNDEENTVSTISNMMKQTLNEEISNLPWMDDDTKKAALDKLDKIRFKIGKPDGWRNDTAIAQEITKIYGKITVTNENHFKNIKSLVQVLREEEIRQLTIGSTPYDHWRVELYDTDIHYYNRWNEVLIPAGILQAPIVSPNLPAYMNFGGLGSWIGSTIINAIDEEGQIFDANYAMVRWWTNSTWSKYTPYKENLISYYDSIIPGSLKEHVNASTYAQFAIAETGGLRQAYQAYKRYINSNGIQESPLPSVSHGNIDQMFFYSYASTHCADYTSFTYAWRTIYQGITPDFIHVNGAVGIMPEFSSAFQCRTGSPMVTPEAQQVPKIF